MTSSRFPIAHATLLIFLVACAVGFVVVGSANLTPKDDAEQYLSIAGHLAHGGGFADDGGPTMVREPMYPAFVAAVFRVTGDNPFVVLVVQALLLGILAAGTFLLARQTMPEVWAAFAGLAVIPLLSAYVGLFLSEMLAACLILAAACTLAAADRRRLPWRFLIAGALLGLAALTKAIVLFFVPIAALAIIVRGRTDFRRALVHAGVLVAAFTIIVFPWMLRNREHFGVLQIASRGGLVLYVRASRTELPPHDRHLLMAQSILGDRLIAKFSPDILGKQALLDGAESMWVEFAALRASGISDQDVNARFGHKAIAIILRHPFAYATDTIQEFFLLNMLAMPVVDMRELLVTGHPSLPDVVKDVIVALLRLVNFVWIALIGYGVWSSRKNPALFWPAFIVVYWNLIHMAIDAIPRYAVPILPLYLIIAVVAIRRLALRRLT